MEARFEVSDLIAKKLGAHLEGEFVKELCCGVVLKNHCRVDYLCSTMY